MTKTTRKTEHLLKKEEKEAYKRLLISAAIVVFFIFTFVLWGPQILVKFAEFIDLIRNSGTPPPLLQDTTPPVPPRFDSLPSATNSAYITITGYAEPGSSVEIFLNKQTVSNILADNSGNFKVDNIRLRDGTNILEARSTDKAGNRSSLGEAVNITLDKTPPLLEVSYPPDNVTFSSDERELTISGKTEENATVTVNGFWAITDGVGNFSSTILLSNGENKLIIEASDAAGNKKQILRTVYLY